MKLKKNIKIAILKVILVRIWRFYVKSGLDGGKYE